MLKAAHKAANSAQKHQYDQDQPGSRGKPAGDPQGKPDSSNSGAGFKQAAYERQPFNLADDQAAYEKQQQIHHQDGDCLPNRIVAYLCLVFQPF